MAPKHRRVEQDIRPRRQVLDEEHGGLEGLLDGAAVHTTAPVDDEHELDDRRILRCGDLWEPGHKGRQPNELLLSSGPLALLQQQLRHAVALGERRELDEQREIARGVADCKGQRGSRHQNDEHRLLPSLLSVSK